MHVNEVQLPVIFTGPVFQLMPSNLKLIACVRINSNSFQITPPKLEWSSPFPGVLPDRTPQYWVF